MCKYFLTIVLFFAVQTGCFAQNGITFLYINGSNNNTKRMERWYERGVINLHPYLKKEFENNQLVKQHLLKNGEYKINEKPFIFFWGYRSSKDLSFVEKNLAISKGFSPWLAYVIRYSITKFLHDAIWVEKFHNMHPILNELHSNILSEYSKGNKVVLYGYSAGSFVTYEYLLTREPYINALDFFKHFSIAKEKLDFIVNHPVNNTCMEALGKDLAVFSATGHIIPNDYNQEQFEKNYLDLNNLTDKYCTPYGAVRGIVNFASPLVLFYSDISDPEYQLTYYNRLLFKYIIENDMFWLTVNYREDPLGFPGGRNLTIGEIENAAKLNINPNKGFIYDLSNSRSHRTVFLTHTSYWSTRRNFSKAVVKAYEYGYKNLYDDTMKPKAVKKYEKKFHIMP